MGRTPCCDKERMKKGAWTPEEDKLLVQYIKENGLGNWRSLPKSAGLSRCGKSYRLRWANYLRPDIKRGPFSLEEEACIIRLQAMLGNRWASIASHMRGRTDNEIKNFWNTHLKKRLLLSKGKVLLQTSLLSSASTLHAAQWESVRLQAEARLSINSSMRCSTSTGKVYCDMFLKLWNSDVGESFRNMTKLARKEKLSDSISDTSSWIKIELNSYTTYEENLTIISGSEVDSYKPGLAMIVSSHSISSNDFSDSSDAALKLLLNLPTSTGLGLVQDPIDNFTNFLDLQYH